MTTITVTSSATLIIQGQEFTLTILELESLHAEIGRALGKSGEQPFADWKEIIKRLDMESATPATPLPPIPTVPRPWRVERPTYLHSEVTCQNAAESS